MSRRFVFSISLILVSVVAASAQVQFSSTSYNSGDYDTNSIVTGDFNNDGILDLVTINTSSLSFYKGLGGGKFANARQQSIPGCSSQALPADLNRDGKLDLALVCGSDQIMIFFGNGDGTFTNGPTLATSNYAYTIALADFNGDHLPDIAVSGCNSSYVCAIEVFLGQGNGTFKKSATLPYGGGQVVAGDFNADGHQDLAVLTLQSASSELAMFPGNGNGTFQTPKLASFTNPVSLAVGDFYNNRIQSLVVLNYVYNDPKSTFYVTTVRYSNGALLLGTPELVTENGDYVAVIAGDLNGDFLDDIAVVGAGPTVPNPAAAYILGKGNGTFQAPVDVAATGQAEFSPFIRDLNLDSRHDLGVAWDDGDSRYGTGGGAFILLNTNAATNCTPPAANKLSVHICARTSGQTVGSTFTFRAAGNAFNGVAKRVELWIDGKKIGQNLEDQLKITRTLSAGKHTASFVVADSFDNHTSSSVSFTAN